MKATRIKSIVFAFLLLSVFSLLSVFGAPAHAALIYGTFGENNSYIMQGWLANDYWHYAASFQSSSDFTLDSLMFPFATGSDVSTQVFATIEIKDGLDSSSNVLESFDIGSQGYGIQLYTVPSADHPQLAAGKTYYIVASGSPGRSIQWFVNDQGYTGLYQYNSGTGAWKPLSGNSPAFAVYGSPVPIPGAVWLLGSGIAGLAGIARKKMHRP